MTHRTINPHRLAAAVGLALALVATAGCQRYHDVEAFVIQRDRLASVEPYTVGPPDSLRVVARNVPEINNQSAVISTDGTITLPLIGELEVAGKTTPEIAAMIEDRALEYYQEAEIIVQVTGYRSKHLYVFGEVGAPGRYAYTGSDTVLDILARAQPTRLADPNRIQVLRPGPDGRTAKRMTIELNKWTHQGMVDRNAQVEEGDIIYVPANGLAAVGLTLQQMLLPIQPAASVIRGPGSIDSAVDSYQGSGGAQ